ncbi:MAG TPA: 30S ribosomal protein S16 [Pirellulales bacterium]|nr:30S ribosomal protein S16 [Pirellulales bacterium]
MSVKIRMKMMGRKHRHFFRICATDSRAPRDGRVIEEIGTYDPEVPDTDARVVLNHERVAYWLGVGAQPSENVRTFIKKYGPEGTHLAQQAAARERLAMPKVVPPPGEPAFVPKPKEEAPAAAEAAPAEAAASEAPAAEGGATAE